VLQISLSCATVVTSSEKKSKNDLITLSKAVTFIFWQPEQGIVGTHDHPLLELYQQTTLHVPANMQLGRPIQSSRQHPEQPSVVLSQFQLHGMKLCSDATVLPLGKELLKYHNDFHLSWQQIHNASRHHP
jgi:hypothetical protein